VPLAFGLQDCLGFERNPYDRIGHLMQASCGAGPQRDPACRNVIRRRRMAAFISGCVALAISASYELIEWWSGARARAGRG